MITEEILDDTKNAFMIYAIDFVDHFFPLDDLDGDIDLIEKFTHKWVEETFNTPK